MSIRIKPKFVIRQVDGSKWVWDGYMNRVVQRIECPNHYLWRPIEKSYLRGWIVLTGPQKSLDIDEFKVPPHKEKLR